MQAAPVLLVPRPRSRTVAEPDPSFDERGEESSTRLSRPTLASIDLEVLEPADPPRGSTMPPPLPERARHRAPATEVTAPVLSALADLAFFETAVEAASFGVVTALGAVPSLAGLALLRDEDSGDFMVVYARGPRAHVTVRSRVGDDDPLVQLAMVRAGPVVVEYGSDRPPPSRHASFGDPWSAMVVPILLGDRCLGVLELVDPLDGRTPGDPARSAVTVIAEHLASFLRHVPSTVRRAFAPEQVGLED